MGRETIDIIIPIFNRSLHTEKCLNSIKKNTENYNLILVEKKQSASKNINDGLKQVKSNWFVLMDDDMVVTPNWLEILYSNAKDGIGQIQPKIVMPFDHSRLWCADILINPLRLNGHLQFDNEEFSSVKKADLLTGACGLYNSEILKKGIIQDEMYRQSQYNDLDFSMQIKKKGLDLIYCGECMVINSRFLQHRNSNNFNRTYFNEKWFGIEEDD